MSAKILKCKCHNPFQDKEHGTSLRVHNEVAKSSTRKSYRCTVCGSEKSVEDK